MSFGQCEITSILLQQIRQIVAEETKEQILRHQNRNSIVLYGIPAGQEEEKVNSILSCANISVSSYRIVKRLGNPRSTNVRPLRVDLNEGIPVPSMRDLAGKLAASPSLNTFHVRLMETNAQRIKGYQERQARRNEKEATEEKLEEKVEKVVSSVCVQSAKPVLELDSATCVSVHFEPDESSSTKTITLSSSSESSEAVTVETSKPEAVMNLQPLLCLTHYNGYLHPVLVEGSRTRSKFFRNQLHMTEWDRNYLNNMLAMADRLKIIYSKEFEYLYKEADRYYNEKK